MYPCCAVCTIVVQYVPLLCSVYHCCAVCTIVVQYVPHIENLPPANGFEIHLYLLPINVLIFLLLLKTLFYLFLDFVKGDTSHLFVVKVFAESSLKKAL